MTLFSSYKIALFSALFGASLCAAASAQTTSAYPVPTAPIVTNLNQDDAIWLAVHGAAQVGNHFAHPAQISGAPGYVKTIPSTGFSLTFAAAQTDMILIPAGTLATGTLTTEANPSDGQRECVLSTQTQTALTWSANTGQTITGGPTALVANTPVCMTYSLSNATWNRSP